MHARARVRDQGLCVRARATILYVTDERIDDRGRTVSSKRCQRSIELKLSFRFVAVFTIPGVA